MRVALIKCCVMRKPNTESPRDVYKRQLNHPEIQASVHQYEWGQQRRETISKNSEGLIGHITLLLLLIFGTTSQLSPYFP